MTKNNYKKNKKGFALLYAVFVSSLILSIALSVSSLALKQVVFSTSEKEGNDAFYAADTGAECALFHDRSTSPNPFTDGIPSITCNNTNVSITNTHIGLYEKFDFVISNLGISGISCSQITVLKTTDNSETKITSFGYNNGGGVLGFCTPNDRSSQRVIELNY